MTTEESANRCMILEDWKKRFRNEAGYCYNEALNLAKTLAYVTIHKDDAHSFAGDFVYAITPDNCPEFWLETAETYEQAVKFCNEIGWEVR